MAEASASVYESHQFRSFRRETCISIILFAEYADGCLLRHSSDIGSQTRETNRQGVKGVREQYSVRLIFVDAWSGVIVCGKPNAA